MAAELHDDSRYHTIEYEPGLEAVCFTWDDYDPGEPFRESLNALHEAIVDRGVEKYLVDTRKITAHDEADKAWIAETWIPNLIDDGVRAGASVYPESAIADMDMEGIEESVNAIDEGYTFKGFTDPDAARSWLADR
jgi:hypothetical protein